MSNTELVLDAQYQTEVVAEIRRHIRENGGEQGENSPWFTFHVPYLLGTNRVIEALERCNYEVEPHGWRLEVRATFEPVLDENGEDYWDMRKRDREDAKELLKTLDSE
jgi:hypothetical protein